MRVPHVRNLTRAPAACSATWPIDVRRIADKYMSSPVHVVVGSLDLRACRTVEQVILFCKDEEEKKEVVSGAPRRRPSPVPAEGGCGVARHPRLMLSSLSLVEADPVRPSLALV